MANEKELKCLDCHNSFKPEQLSLHLKNADTAFCQVSGLFHRFDDPFVLSYDDGKAVQEILNRYKGELVSEREGLQLVHEDIWEVQKDIDYITGLTKLFD